MSEEKKKRGCLGCLGRLLVVGVVLLLVVLGVGRLLLPGVIKSQGESIGSQILGTPVAIGDVSLSVLGGSATLKDIRIANYPGFEGKDLLSVGEAGGDIGLAGLLGGKVVIERVWAEKIGVSAEVDSEGRQNLQVLLETMQKNIAPTSDTVTAEPVPAEEKPLQLPEIRLNKLEVSTVNLAMTDKYAVKGETWTGSLAVGRFAIVDLLVPATGDASTQQNMTVEVENVSVKAPEHFERPEFLRAASSSVVVDIPRLMRTLETEEKDVLIPLITNKDTLIVAETKVKNEDDPTPQNVREFALVAQNSLVPGTVKTLEELNAEAAAKRAAAEEEAKKAEAAKQGALESLTSLATGSQNTASQAEQAIAPAAEPLGVKITLTKLDVQGFELEHIFVPDPALSTKVYSTEVAVENVVFPHPDGNISTVVLRTRPRDKESKVSVKLKGELLAFADGKPIEVISDTTNLNVAGLPQIKDGRLDSTLNLVLQNQRAKGTLRFATKGFRFAPESAEGGVGSTATAFGGNVGKIAIEQSLRVHETSGAPPFELPIDYKIDEVKYADVLAGMFKVVGSNVTNVVGATVGGAVDKVGDVGGKMGESLGGATQGLNDGAKKVDGAIQGLFGRKKKEEEK